MREICSYGSAGGEIGNPDLPYPDPGEGRIFELRRLTV